MPIYTYKCHTCREIFDVRHGMFFEGQRCTKCHSDDVFRLPSLSEKQVVSDSKKTGKVVKDYIEKTKKEIKDYKKNLSKEGF